MDANVDSSSTNVFLFTSPTEKKSGLGILGGYEAGASYLPNPTYALSVQKSEIFSKYRQEAFLWMLGVCRERGGNSEVAYYGINYFDRFLSVKVIQRDKLELLSWLCIHLASLMFDNRSTNLSLREIKLHICDTYTSSDVNALYHELLQVLCFRLVPYSPYSEGGSLLHKSGHEELFSDYCHLLNGICMRYESINICPESIMYICVYLTWVYSYPDKPLPTELKKCTSVFSYDVEHVLRLVHELFPMMDHACDVVQQKYSSKSSPLVVSPTSIVQATL